MFDQLVLNENQKHSILARIQLGLWTNSYVINEVLTSIGWVEKGVIEQIAVLFNIGRVLCRSY